MSTRKTLPKEGDRAIGYGRPPRHSRFKPGKSGNERGRPKSKKRRDIATQVQEVFTRPVPVRKGSRTEKVPAIIALVELALLEALKGDKKAMQFSYRIAELFGVFKLKDRIDVDLSMLSEEERETCMQGARLLNKAGVLFRFDEGWKRR